MHKYEYTNTPEPSRAEPGASRVYDSSSSKASSFSLSRIRCAAPRRRAARLDSIAECLS